MPRRDVTKELKTLRDKLAQEQAAADAARLAHTELQQEHNLLRDARIHAYGENDDAEADVLTEKIAASEAKLGPASARQAGLELRVKSAREAVARFEEDNGRELLEARVPRLQELTAELNAAATAAVRLNRELITERESMNQATNRIPGLRGRYDGPESVHAWEPALTALEHAVRDKPALEPPLPRFMADAMTVG